MYKNEDRIFVVDHKWTVWGAVTEKIVEKDQENAFYVMDVEDVVNKFEYWKKSFPRIDPFYAMKCNSYPALLELLSSLGVGFHCASQTEFCEILSLRVKPNRIIFANPTKPVSHIRNAQAMGIRTLTFDSEFELHKIKQHFPKAKLILRFRNDAQMAIATVGEKYGCDPRTEGPALLKQARILDLDVSGISFYVGTGCQEPEAFSRGIEYSAELFSIGLSLGHNMDLLNVGGGFPGELDLMMDNIVSAINTSLEQHFPLGCGVRVIAEPGRFFVSSAFTLACCIFAKRLIYDDHGDLKRAMYFINDGKHGSFSRMNCINESIVAVPLKGYDEPTVLSNVWGPTSDGTDKIFKDISLPNLNIGEWLVFRNSGAYTLPLASCFEGFVAPKVTAYIKNDLWAVMKDKPPFAEDRFIFEKNDNLLSDENSHSNCKKPRSEDRGSYQNSSTLEDFGIPEFPYW